MQIHFVANSLKVKYLLSKMCLLENLENAHKILAKINDLSYIWQRPPSSRYPFSSSLQCNMKEYEIIFLYVLLPIFVLDSISCDWFSHVRFF